MKLTGERLMPDQQWGDTNHREHVGRYMLACHLVRAWWGDSKRGPKVLDIASGEGYGTRMLRNSHRDISTTGVDLSEEAVRYALNKYGPWYQRGDIRALPESWTDTFDVAVCFETIEHVAETTQALAELRRVVKDTGFLVISSPNRGVYPAGNRFHERELTTGELVTALREDWNAVEVYHQRDALASVLEPSSGPEPQAMTFARLNPREPEMYATCICGLQPLGLSGVAVA